MGQGSNLGRGKIFPTCKYWLQGLASILYNGCQVSFPGVKWPRHGINHPSPSSAKGKEIVGLYLYDPFGPSWPVMGHTLPFIQSSVSQPGMGG